MKKNTFSLILVCLLFTSKVVAVEWNGHITAAVLKPLGVIGTAFDDHADYQSLSKAGLTLSHSIDDSFAVKMKLTSKESVKNRTPFFDIIKLNYTPNSTFDLNIGRLKLPVWMHSEYKDVGHLFPWLELPGQVYTQNPIDYFDGLQIGFHRRLFNSVGIDAYLYTGTSKEQYISNGPTYQAGGTLATQTELYFDFQDIFGTQLLLSNDDLVLNFSYLQARDRGFAYTDIHSNLGAGKQQIRLKNDFNFGKVEFLNIGSKYQLADLMLTGEWIKIKTEGNFFRDYQGYYLTTAYNITESIMPHLTYSRSTKVSSTAFPDSTDSIIIGINYLVV